MSQKGVKVQINSYSIVVLTDTASFIRFDKTDLTMNTVHFLPINIFNILETDLFLCDEITPTL